MDYPKSVPNIGLVGGKFVDENTGTGQVGSLIPAIWGSAVTDEIINVIKDAGLLPKEGENNQLTAAIKEIIKKNGLSSTPQGVLNGAINDIAKHDIGTYSGPTTDKPTAGGIYLRLKYPGANTLAFDLYAHMASGADTFGFRRVGADGTYTWREVYHSGNFDPATKMPITGGLYSPAFSSLRVVDSSAIGNPGSHLSYGTDGQLTNCFNSVCNKGTGTGGFTWRTVNATNSVTGPTMSYTAEGVLTVPTGLWVPALTANTTVLTQAEGYTGQYAASCAFVATAVGRKVSSDRLVTAGFYSGAKTAPYFVHNDGSVVYLQVDRPKDTALLTANGWSKNADTGEIIQRAEVAIGDSVGSMLVSVTWPFQFPSKCLRADISLRAANGSPILIIAGFYELTATGATVKFEELNSAVQSGLVLMVEAVGY